jgi:hypothetical protein
MSENTTRTRTDRFNMEWQYAKDCWSALVIGANLPPPYYYNIYTTDERTGETKLTGKKPITPQRIVYDGRSYFG